MIRAIDGEQFNTRVLFWSMAGSAAFAIAMFMLAARLIFGGPI